MDRLVEITTAGTAARQASLEQNSKRSVDGVGARCVGQELHAVVRVDQTREEELRIGCEFVKHVAYGLLAHELVGHQNPFNTKAARHLKLSDGRQREAPCAVIEAQLE